MTTGSATVVVEGRKERQEIPTNLQDGEPRGEGQSHALHENHIVDLQTPTTTMTNKK